eukprot:218058_1
MSVWLKRANTLIHQRWFILGFWYSVLTSFGTLHGILFGTYHLDMFLSVWELSAIQIASVHSIYMIWNVLNDLISGYISDWYQHKYAKHGNSRLTLIKPMNILWCFVTLLPFYSFGNYIPKTFHYFITISLYDGFFSFVCIVRGALWTDDLTSNQNERVKLQLIQKPMNAIIVSLLSFVSYYFWDKNNLINFKILLWITIIISIIATYISCYKLQQHLSQTNTNTNHDQKTLLNKDKNENNKSLTQSTTEGLFSLGLFIKQVSKQINLWMFIGASVINETQGIFLGQFTSIFTDVLLSEWSSSKRASYLSFMSFTMTCIAILSLYLIQQKYIELYNLCKIAIGIKILCGIIGLFLYFIIGNTVTILSPLFCAVYILMNKICVTIFVSFFMIIIPNLCDEQKAYRVKNNLCLLSSMVSMYWGLHALCAKPFNSLGPVIGTYVLDKYGYNRKDNMTPLEEYLEIDKINIKNGCFQLMLWFLLLLSILQYMFWRKYSLFGKKLLEIQRILQHSNT